MTYKIPFSDLGRYKQPRLDTPPAEDILAAIRRGDTYTNLAAIYSVSESTLRRRVYDSGLARRRTHAAPPPMVSNDYPAWMDDGLCAQTDPELFYPESGKSPRLAKKVCAQCPVIAECLAWALDRDERFGVYGGTTPADRKRMRKAQS